jgi:hypothetical protein
MDIGYEMKDGILRSLFSCVTTLNTYIASPATSSSHPSCTISRKLALYPDAPFTTPIINSILIQASSTIEDWL